MSYEKSRPRFVFVIGVSRSGTTLLKRLLNTYPDVLLWGEHHTFIRPLADAFYRVIDSPAIFEDYRPWNERVGTDEREHHLHGWINPFDRDDWQRYYRHLLDDIFIPSDAINHRFVGFKDPGYACTPQDRSIDFLHQIYPDALFVFIVRTGFNQVASARLARQKLLGPSRLLRDGRALCKRWITQNRQLFAYHKSGKLNSFLIRYEDLIQGSGDIHHLLQEMDLEWGPPQSELVEGEPGWISSFDDATYNDRWHQLPYLWRCFSYAYLASASRDFGYVPPRLPRFQQEIGRVLVYLAYAQFAARGVQKRFVKHFLSAPSSLGRSKPV
jgi:hypothetical protein